MPDALPIAHDDLIRRRDRAFSPSVKTLDTGICGGREGRGAASKHTQTQ